MIKKIFKNLYHGCALEKFLVFYLHTVPIKYKYYKTQYNPIFIYYCGVGSAKTGLCDRLRSMVNMYESAKELGVKYKIAHFYPFDIYNYLKPNEVDWRINQDQILYNKKLVQVNKILARRSFYYWLPKKAYKIAKRKSKLQIHIYGNPNFFDDNDNIEKYSKLFNELFKPSDELQNIIDLNKLQIGGEYVSVTTRFQNLMGDFYEGEKFKTLETEEEKQDYISRCIAQIEIIHKKHPDKKILVTSDSMRFLDVAKHLPYAHVNPGNLIHMAFTTNTDYDVHMKPFVDLYTISYASKVYLLKTGLMYKSAFAKTAALINLREYEVIEF